MKLLLLLLPACAFAFYVPGHSGNLTNQRFEKPTPLEKAHLAEDLGFDIDARKARLNHLFEQESPMLRSSDTDFDDLLKKIVPIATTKPNDEAIDIEDVNERAGVSEYLFQGDIDLSEEQLNALENAMSKSHRKKRQALSMFGKWPNNTVYFYFDAAISQRKKDSIQAAHAYIQEHTCVSFVEDSTAKNRVKVRNGTGCSTSTTGFRGGEQRMSIGNGCEAMRVTLHEFMPTLGFIHTQARSDRDDFITVNTSNIPVKKKVAHANILYTPYEYGSVMQYSVKAGAIRPNFSMLPIDSNYTYTMGNGLVSFYDMQMVNYHYCNGTCTVDNSAVCQNNSYPNPRNCARCNCPRGYGGDLCDERPAGCGETLAATKDWQKYRVTVGDKNDKVTRDVFTTCNHWITASQGKLAQVKITNIENGQCNYGCPFNGIEVKASANKNVTNPVYCCNEFNDQIITSQLNPVPLVSFNRFYVSSFDIEYRFVDGETTTTVSTLSTTTTAAPVITTTTPVFNPQPSCVKEPIFARVRTLVFNDRTSVNQHLANTHYHSNETVMNNWTAKGWRATGSIGRVINSNLDEKTMATLKTLCPSLVKLRAFVSAKDVEFMTTEENVMLPDETWQELPPVGYCSKEKACGATRNVRSVCSKNGDNFVYSPNDAVLKALNSQPRYKGTLTGTMCWFF